MAEIYKNPFIQDKKSKKKDTGDWDAGEQTPFEWLDSQSQRDKDRLYKKFNKEYPNTDARDVFQHRNPFNQPEDETTVFPPGQDTSQSIQAGDIEEMQRIRSLPSYDERMAAIDKMLARVKLRQSVSLEAARRRLEGQKIDPYKDMYKGVEPKKRRKLLAREIPGIFGKNPHYEDWVGEKAEELEMLKEWGSKSLPGGKGKPRGRHHWQERYK